MCLQQKPRGKQVKYIINGYIICYKSVLIGPTWSNIPTHTVSMLVSTSVNTAWHVSRIHDADSDVTQWVARLTRNVEVLGSSPIKSPHCFNEQETLPLLLSTGWFQEWIRACMEDWLKCRQNQTKYKIMDFMSCIIFTQNLYIHFVLPYTCVVITLLSVFCENQG